MLRDVPAHTCTERCIHMLYQFCLSFYIANFSFLTFNLSDNCFLVSECLMRTQLATLFIILGCEKVLLSPHSQSSFAFNSLVTGLSVVLSFPPLWNLLNLELYICGVFFPLSNFGCVQAFIFFKCLFYLFLLIFLGFP